MSPAPKFEKAVMALAVHARQIEGRLCTVEEHLSRERQLHLDHATHDDLLDLRLHAAKLAGEVARMNVELRAEIERLSDEVRQQAASPSTDRLQALAEAIADLDDRLYDPPSEGISGPADDDDRPETPPVQRVTTATPAERPTANGHPAIKDAEIIDLERDPSSPKVVVDLDADDDANRIRSA